jgi:hypothetical protein
VSSSHEHWQRLPQSRPPDSDAHASLISTSSTVFCREQAAALYLPAFLISVMEVVDIMADKHAGARPGSFNDADMIVVVSNISWVDSSA